MANLQETSQWEVGIYQLETSDPVMGGENGIDNKAPRQLANRTLWLKNELARQIGLVNQSIGTTSTQKADKSTQITAGNGLTGGGDLSTARTLAMGTPSKITATSANVAVSNTHSHEIDKASTTTQGIVQLNDSLTSTATNQALTANMGKTLNEQKLDKSGGVLTGTLFAANSGIKAASDNDTGIEWVRDGVVRLIADGRERLHIAHGGTSLRTQEGISLTLQNDKNLVLYDNTNQAYWSSNKITQDIATLNATKVDSTTLATTQNAGIVQLNDSLTSTATNQALSANQGKLLNDKIAAANQNLDTKVNKSGDTLTGTLYVATSGIKGAIDQDTGFEWTQDGVLKTFVDGQERLIIEHSGLSLKTANNFKLSLQNDKNLVLYDGNQVLFSSNAVLDSLSRKLNKTENAASARRLQTARNIALTGAVTGNVNFDGSANVSINTDLKPINRRDYTGTLTPSHPSFRSQTVNTTGSVEVLPNGKIVQYFSFVCPIYWFLQQSTSDFYRSRLGRTAFNANDTSPILELPLWTPMPNKIQEARIHLGTAGNHYSYGEAMEWIYDWDSIFQSAMNVKDKAYFAFRRWAGNNDEPVTFNIIVEGY